MCVFNPAVDFHKAIIEIGSSTLTRLVQIELENLATLLERQSVAWEAFGHARRRALRMSTETNEQAEMRLNAFVKDGIESAPPAAQPDDGTGTSKQVGERSAVVTPIGTAWRSVNASPTREAPKAGGSDARQAKVVMLRAERDAGATPPRHGPRD